MAHHCNSHSSRDNPPDGRTAGPPVMLFPLLGQKALEEKGYNDTETGVPFGIPKGARCVQRFDDSLEADHTTYRDSLRSSSIRKPRDPLLKVVIINFFMVSQY